LTSDIFANIQLENGVQIAFKDCTNRYYGDYHRICIEVNLSFVADHYKNIYKFQTLERMGVSSADVAAVQTELIDAFRNGTMCYMAGENFPAKFLQAYNKRKPVLLAGLR